MKLSLPTILHLVVGGLGLISFFIGFANIAESGGSFFENGIVVPALFLLSGLFALPAILPGENKKPGLAPAAFALAAWLTVLFFTFSTDSDVGTGTILLMIFGFFQTAGAVAAYLFDEGILKPPQPNQYGHQPPAGQFPPSGQFPVPPQQQPQQPQPGQFGAPPGQQTTFAPQQGQFGQPPQPGQPGTPPGGYPQQG
jgi:hypothetical protein